MTEPLHCPRVPCSSCPYRRDHPSGVWSFEEYEKLRGYDTNDDFATFLCHQSNATGVETVCTGWMHVHAESAAVRLAVLKGEIPDDARYDDCPVPLYETGNEAADAGQAEIEAPTPEATVMAARLVRRRAARFLEDGE